MSTSSHRHRNQHIHRNLNYHPRHSPSNNRNDQRKKKRKIGTRSPNRDTNLSQQDTDKPKVVVVTLPWHRNDCHSIFPVPLKTEQSLLTVLLRTDCRDRGMMRDCPPQVLKRIRKACKSSGVNLTQALSLRRHHIVLRNPNAPSMSHLGLGNIRDVQKSATLFEDALENYMRTFPNISFCTEQQQRNDFFQKVKKLEKEGRQKQGRGVPPRLPPTPDFLFNSPVRISNPTNANVKAYSNVNVNDKIGADFVAHWIDAKMFYGASTIPAGTPKHAVGALLRTADRYVDLYGTGAFVFSEGCGVKLVSDLLSRGVLALDCGPLDMRAVREHQATWCGNVDGEVLF